MKTLFVTIGIFLHITCHAQISLIGKTEKDVKTYLSGSKYIFQDSSIVLKNGVNILTPEYHPSDGDTTGLIPIGYVLKNGICVIYTLHSFLNDLPTLIEAMRKKYKRIDDTHWIDENARYEATLWKDGKGFYMSFKEL